MHGSISEKVTDGWREGSRFTTFTAIRKEATHMDPVRGDPVGASHAIRKTETDDVMMHVS